MILWSRLAGSQIKLAFVCSFPNKFVVQYIHMKLSIPAALGIFFAAFLFMLYTAPAEAFSKDQVDRYSFANTDTGQAVYTLSFVIGNSSKDLYIPIVGERDLANGTRKNRFGFSLEPGYEGGSSKAGEAIALIIAKAEIVDGYYKVPAGTSVAFKIVSLFKVKETEANTYKFIVTELPFFVGDTRDPRSFNPSELKYMKSNFEALYFERDTE